MTEIINQEAFEKECCDSCGTKSMYGCLGRKCAFVHAFIVAEQEMIKIENAKLSKLEKENFELKDRIYRSLGILVDKSEC